jgi:iron complex transport system substrate-binding protein
MADQAQRFRRLDWQAEATIALNPDLVLIGPNDRSITRRMLAAQGLRVIDVELVTDLAAAAAQIRRFAALLGHSERGERLVAKLEAARAKLRGLPRTRFSTALVIERGGYTAGPQSLVATLLAEAGLRPPPSGPHGYGGFIPLEKLLMLRPDVVVLKDPPARPQDQGALFFTHPAVQALYPPERRIALPTRFTMCGGPALIAALDYLADILARLPSLPDRP